MASDNPFAVSGPMLKEVAQGLLEIKRMARSIENSVLAFAPMVNDPEVGRILSTVAIRSSDIDRDILAIYNRIAREAFQQ